MTTVNEDDRVELVARALAKADGKDPDAPAWVQGYGARERTWGICWRDQYSTKARAVLASLQGADTVTEAMVEAALKAIVPGGAAVWHWLPTDKAGQKPHQTARNVMRCALEAAVRTAAPTAQDDTGARLEEGPVQDDDAEELRELARDAWERCDSGAAEKLERIANRLANGGAG